MTWHYEQLKTLTEQTIDKYSTDGVSIAVDDLDSEKSVAYVILESAEITDVFELAGDDIEITLVTPNGAEITLILPFTAGTLISSIDHELHPRDDEGPAA